MIANDNLRKSLNASTFNHLNIGNSNNNFINGKNEDNSAIGNSNYSTLTYRQPKSTLLNNLPQKDNKIGFQTNFKTTPIASIYSSNTVNVRNVQKNNLYFNNYPQKIDNIKYSYFANNDNKPPIIYPIKTNNQDILGFNPYMTSTIPKIIQKRSNTVNTAIPKSLKIPQINNNSFNNYQSLENTNYLNKVNIAYQRTFGANPEERKAGTL